MSQENVEIIRRALEHFDRTGEPDWDQIDADVEVYDHDIPDAGIYRGHKGYAAWLADWGEAWSDFWMPLIEGSASTGRAPGARPGASS